MVMYVEGRSSETALIDNRHDTFKVALVLLRRRIIWQYVDPMSGRFVAETLLKALICHVTGGSKKQPSVSSVLDSFQPSARTC